MKTERTMPDDDSTVLTNWIAFWEVVWKAIGNIAVFILIPIFMPLFLFDKWNEKNNSGGGK